MEEKCWERFLETGKVADYLCYKGREACGQTMEKYKGEEIGEPDYGDRYGAFRSACR